MKNDASIKQETSADTPVLYVGIDVSKDTLAIDAGEHYAGTIANTRGAIRRVVGQIRHHAGRGATLRFALEETGPYSLPLRFALDALGQQACLLDPCKVRHYALAMGIASKSDPIDARVIRQFAEANRSEPTALPPKALLQLRELVRARALLVKVREMVSNLLRISTNALCRSVLREVVVLLDRRVEKLGEEMSRQIREDETLNRKAAALETVRGVGRLTAETVVALAPEIGSLPRSQAAGLPGLVPHVRESGLWKGRRRIGGGRAELRRALYMPTLVACRYNPVLKAVYERLVKRGKPHKVALAAVMRKLFVHMNKVAAEVDKAETKA